MNKADEKEKNVQKFNDTLMDPNLKLDVTNDKKNHVFEDKRRYRNLFGKLIYLTITKPNNTFAAVSQYMQNLRKVHWKVLCRILIYLKKAIGVGFSTREEAPWK